jgi:hypothetical protein
LNGLQRVGDGWAGAADPRSEGTAIAVDAKGRQTLIDGKSLKDGAPSASVH